MSIVTTAQVALQREYVIKHMLPDTCTITPHHSGTVSVSAAGVMSSTNPSPRVWRTLTNIPCRMDYSRAFRPGALSNQTTSIDEYIMELPFDIVFDTADRVVVDGQTFLMRKVKDKSNWDVSVEAVLTKLGVNDASV